jgi:hypothetical protein
VPGSWKRSGWVVEKPGEYELIDYTCARCSTRIGVPKHLATDSNLLKQILKTAYCKCAKR